MSNPLAPARQHLYDALSANTVLAAHNVSVYPEWPQEGTPYPMCFLQRVASNLVTPIGSDRIDDLSLTDIHLVFERRTPLSTRDTILDEITAPGFIHRSRGDNAKGNVTSCSIEYIREIPYSIDDDWLPRVIVGCRLFANG